MSISMDVKKPRSMAGGQKANVGEERQEPCMLWKAGRFPARDVSMMEVLMKSVVFAATAAIATLIASTAFAECTGTNGRGWGKGKGKGEFVMSAGDKECRISFPGFTYEKEDRRVPANEVTLTRAPKSGKISVLKEGIIYTPVAGFKGKDKFCTKNTAKGEKGTLAGCVTVTVK